jgi:hypothetical protein
VSDQDYGAMTEEQQIAVAQAIYQLTPEQLIKVVAAITVTLGKCYGVRVVATDEGVMVSE